LAASQDPWTIHSWVPTFAPFLWFCEPSLPSHSQIILNQLSPSHVHSVLICMRFILIVSSWAAAIYSCSGGNQLELLNVPLPESSFLLSLFFKQTMIASFQIPTLNTFQVNPVHHIHSVTEWLYIWSKFLL
jgi:hypothetical protein